MAARLRVMTLNLRRDVASDGPNAWPRRAGAVASLVRSSGASLVGTQEGLPHMLAGLDARLPGWRRVGGCRDGDGAGEHVAMLYDPARLLLVAHGDVWLSDAPHAPGSRSWGNRLPRHATWARFTDQDAGASFTAVSTHLDHESAASRERSAAFLATRFPGALLMGDFNEAPRGPAWRHVAAGRVDPHEGETGTFHGFTGVARERIDWILVPEAWGVRGARVLRDGPMASDHYAVVVDVAVTRTRSGPTPARPAASSTAPRRARRGCGT